MKSNQNIIFKTSLLFFMMLRNCAVESFNYSHRNVNTTEPNSSLQKIAQEIEIPPKPNYTLTLTAKPDPFVTDDPTSKAKLTLRRDLFSNKHGKIVFYALLVTLQDYCEPPENGTWNGTWPAIPNWESENTSYQVTPPYWEPFKNLSLSEVAYILGDNACDSNNKYCNVPLKENTKYALKIRAFTNYGFQDTDIILFETLAELPLIKITSILAVCLFVTAAAVSVSIFNFGWIKGIRLLPGRKGKDSSPVPEALSHKSFLKYSQELLNTPGRLGNEFHLLGTLSSDVSTLCLHAQRIDNRYKNRYGNILPFDMTRVKLSIIDDDPSSDYINASFIKGYKQEIQYIATQGPKEETCHDFYRMIVEQHIDLIVMLTELNENGIEKCFKYYPELDEVLKFKEITVVCKQSEDLEVCTKCVLVISTGGRNLVVTHLRFKNWRDFESPDDTEVMLKFCELTHKQRCKGYTLVHCSAGAGRTGTFIAIDILLRELKTTSKISVFNTVLKLRQQRINMVQTEAQLGYIYKCISRAIEKSLPRTKEI